MARGQLRNSFARSNSHNQLLQRQGSRTSQQFYSKHFSALDSASVREEEDVEDVDLSSRTDAEGS